MNTPNPPKQTASNGGLLVFLQIFPERLQVSKATVTMSSFLGVFLVDLVTPTKTCKIVFSSTFNPQSTLNMDRNSLSSLALRDLQGEKKTFQGNRLTAGSVWFISLFFCGLKKASGSSRSFSGEYLRRTVLYELIIPSLEMMYI